MIALRLLQKVIPFVVSLALIVAVTPGLAPGQNAPSY